MGLVNTAMLRSACRSERYENAVRRRADCSYLGHRPASQVSLKSLAVLVALATALPCLATEMVSTVAARHRILLEGFHNGRIGYEFVLPAASIRALVSLDGIGGNYYSFGGCLRVAYRKHLGDRLECGLGVALGGRYSQVAIDNEQAVSAYSLQPSVHGGLTKVFGHFVLGGLADLALWEFGCMGTASQGGWSATRRFAISPALLIGYEVTRK